MVSIFIFRDYYYFVFSSFYSGWTWVYEWETLMQVVCCTAPPVIYCLPLPPRLRLFYFPALAGPAPFTSAHAELSPHRALISRVFHATLNFWDFYFILPRAMTTWQLAKQQLLFQPFNVHGDQSRTLLAFQNH